MIAGIFFATTRCIELLFLIPLIGLLSYLVHGYVERNQLTPDYILVLFIVSVLAGVWAALTLIFYFSARRSGHFLALTDLAIFAALIGGVATLRGIAPASCSADDGPSFSGYAQLGPFAGQWSHACAVLKASFALGIICIIAFFWSFLFALWVHHHYRREHPEYTSRRVTERYHHSGNSRRSASRGSRAPGPPARRSGDYDDRRSRRASSRGAYSSRRSYV